MKLLSVIVISLLFVSALACTSNEMGNSKDVNPETVYMDYHIDYTEGEDSVNCFLQYRFAGENGTTLLLSAPSSVSIDGKELIADSAGFSGVYYEKQFAAATFTGNHTIAFTDINGVTKTEVFNFHRTILAGNITSANKQTDLVLSFENTEPGDLIEVSLSDTSGVTDDIKIKGNVVAGKLTVSSAQLQSLSSGTCTLDIYRTLLKPLQQPTAEGGKLLITYIIKETEIELRADTAEPITTL